MVAEKITAIALNSAYGVIAVGTITGMALVDIVTSSMIYSWSNSELQGRDAIIFGVPSQNSDASPSEVRIRLLRHSGRTKVLLTQLTCLKCSHEARRGIDGKGRVGCVAQQMLASRKIGSRRFDSFPILANY